MRNPELEITILCGGRGRRMEGLTDNRQKCMLEVEGKPVLEHVLDQMADAFGSAKVFLLTGYRGKDIYNYFRQRYRNLELEYISAGEAIETRLTLLATENAIKGEAFLSSAGDVIAKASELSDLVNMRPDRVLGTLLIASKHEVALTHGFAKLDNNQVINIEYPPEKPVPGSGEYRLMDIGFFSKRFLEHLKSHDVAAVSEILKRVVELGEILEGKVYRDTWFHFITAEDLRVSVKF